MNTTILFLASDSLIRKAICHALESAGYVVLAASDVGDAADWLKKCTPALLMVRHYTEAISGHSAATHLSRICPGVPVLMVGGLLDDGGLEDREAVEGFEIFPKPFQAAELIEKVKQVLVKHSRQNNAARESQ